MPADAPGKRRPFLKIYLGAIRRHEGLRHCTTSFTVGNVLSEKFRVSLRLFIRLYCVVEKKKTRDKYYHGYFHKTSILRTRVEIISILV